MSSNTHHIYTVHIGESEEPVYVGCSLHPEQRLKGHLKTARAGRFPGRTWPEWLRGYLLDPDREPLRCVVRRSTSDTVRARALEAETIRLYLSQGVDLKNEKGGGGGVHTLMARRQIARKTRLVLGKPSSVRKTSSQVRRLRRDGMTFRDVSKALGVSVGTAHAMASGFHWTRRNGL